MTTKHRPDTSALTDLQSWAAEQLDLAHDGTRASARKAWLRRLSECELVPPALEHQLGRLLLADHSQPLAESSHPSDVERDEGLRGPAGSDGATRRKHVLRPSHDLQLAEATQSYLRDQIDRLAGEFLSLEPNLRSARYHELHGRALRFPAAVARIEALRPALLLRPERATGGPPNADALGDQIVRQFVMRPVERARARRKLLIAVEDEPKAWAKAAGWLQRHHGEIAALDEPLIRQLIDWRRLGKYDHVRNFFAAPRKFVTRRQQSRFLAIALVVTIVAFLGLIVIVQRATTNERRADEQRSLQRRTMELMRQSEQLRGQSVEANNLIEYHRRLNWQLSEEELRFMTEGLRQMKKMQKQ